MRYLTTVDTLPDRGFGVVANVVDRRFLVFAVAVLSCRGAGVPSVVHGVEEEADII